MGLASAPAKLRCSKVSLCSLSADAASGFDSGKHSLQDSGMFLNPCEIPVFGKGPGCFFASFFLAKAGAAPFFPELLQDVGQNLLKVAQPVRFAQHADKTIAFVISHHRII